MVTLYKVINGITGHFRSGQVCGLGRIQPIREQDVFTWGHRSFKQEVIYIQGAKFKRGGRGEGDSFVSIHDKHTLLLELKCHASVCVCV